MEPRTLEEEIVEVINRHSAENGSNTPDFILGRYLMSCLLSFNEAVNSRERWYGRESNTDSHPLENPT